MDNTSGDLQSYEFEIETSINELFKQLSELREEFNLHLKQHDNENSDTDI